MSDYYDLGVRRWRPLAKAAERQPDYPELSTLLGRGSSEPGLGYEDLIAALWGALAGAWLKIQELRGQVDDSHFDGELRVAEEPDIDLEGRLAILEALVRTDGMRISSLEENRRDDLDKAEGSFGAISEELGEVRGRLDKLQENQWVDLQRLELLKERIEKLKAPAAAVEVEVTSGARPKTSFSFSPGWPPVEHTPRDKVIGALQARLNSAEAVERQDVEKLEAQIGNLARIAGAERKEIRDRVRQLEGQAGRREHGRGSHRQRIEKLEKRAVWARRQIDRLLSESDPGALGDAYTEAPGSEPETTFAPGWPPAEHTSRGRGLDGEKVSTEPACPICQGFGRLYRAGGGWLPLEPDTRLSGGRQVRCPCRDSIRARTDTIDEERRRTIELLRGRAKTIWASFGEDGRYIATELETCADIIEGESE